MTFYRIFLLFFAFSSFYVAEGCSETSNFRLTDNVYPTHYDLSIRQDLENLLFEGNVSIQIISKYKTSTLKLHSKNINITSAKLTAFEGASTLDAVKITYCEFEETASLEFETELVGEARLEILFDGLISNEKLSGLYAINKSINGKVRYSTATHFEPLNARSAFPCFDEPSMKATFSISIIAPNDRIVLSNMPVISNISVSETESKIVFAKTPKMSSYLVCFVVGDYEFVEQKSVDGQVAIRVYTVVGKRDQARFALDVAVRSVDFLQNYLKVAYQLPKLDIIALEDFDVGGMENWGLITQKELTTLIDEKKSSISQKQRVASIVAHEVAHQWFGDLVTMKWWTDIWLNEGFANFFECFQTHEFFKQWNYWSLCLQSDFSQVLFDDSFHNGNSVKIPKLNQSEMDVAFDLTIYNKGSAMIRMMEKFIGEEAFRSALNDYFTQKQYSNAVTDDILKIFDKHSPKRVNYVMNNWFNQKGYPYITVRRIGPWFNLLQQKFSLDGHNDENEKKMLWKIPIIYSREIFGTQNTVMQEQEKQFLAKQISDFNVGSFGFYRVKYTTCQYDELFSQLKRGQLQPEHRFSLQNDYFAFAKAGLHSTVDYMKYLESFADEKELFIWRSIDQSLNEIKSMIAEEKCHQEMNKFIQRLLSGLNNYLLNSEISDDLTILLRVLVYRRLGLSGNQAIIEDSHKKFRDHYNNIKLIDPNYREAVFQIVASNATDNEYEQFFELFQNSDDAAEKNEIAKSLGYSSSQKQLEKALRFSISSEVGITDSTTMFSSVASSSSANTQISWNLFVENVNFFKRRFDDKPTGVIKAILSPITSIQKWTEIQAFVEEQKLKNVNKTLRKSLESIRVRRQWSERDAKKVCSYLRMISK